MLDLRGAFTALVTPFKQSLALDEQALDRLVDAQLEAGIAGLVPCGTTGESPTLEEDELISVVARVVRRANGKVPVIAGAGSNSTTKAIALSKQAVDAGATAVMHVMPYYNKPTQGGLIEHVRLIAESIPKTPIVLYNVPGRTASDLVVDSVEAICAAHPNVVAIKEATGNVLRAQEIVRRLGSRLTVLCGDDALTLPMMASGAQGVISVTSNVFPAAVQRVCALMLEGHVGAAREAHLALLPVHDVMFVESNPGPVKSALADASVIAPYVRPPLVFPNRSVRETIAGVVGKVRETSGRAAR